MFRLLLSVFSLCAVHELLASDVLFSNQPARSLVHNSQSEKDTAISSSLRRLDEAERAIRRRGVGQAGTESRALLQNSDDAELTVKKVNCRLPSSDVDTYLDRDTRTWRITDTLLDLVENELQTIVDCTEEGDTIVFDATGTGLIQFASRVTILWPLTITTAIDHNKLVDGVFPKAETPTALICPQENEGVFLVKTKNVIFANLAFERCVFEDADGEKAIVEVEECTTEKIEDTVRFHHVSFGRNRLIGAVGLRVHSPSCSAIEMIDVSFSDNTCAGICGAVLSSQSKLQEIKIEANEADRFEANKPAVISAPFGSQTVVERVTATDNECPAFYIQEGFLTLLNSTFSRNSVKASKDYAVGGCVHLEDAGLTAEDCIFRKNKAERGGVIKGREADIIITNCIFEENKADQGGVLFINEQTSLSVDSCTFKENRADDEGGVIFATESEVTVTDITLTLNSAAKSAGGFYMTDSSSLEMTTSDFKKNRAEYGGVGVIHENSTAVVLDCLFERNSAVRSAGSLYVQDSEMTVDKCRFKDGNASFGGYLYARRASLDVNDSSFVGGISDSGGALDAREESEIVMRKVSMKNNLALEMGGALHVREDCSLKIDDSEFISNGALKDGGVALLDAGSSGNFTDCTFAKNNVNGTGGVAYIVDSQLEARRCQFSKSIAKTSGGFVASSRASTSIFDSGFADGASVEGGCLQVLENGSTYLQNVSLTSCSAEKQGGAVHLNKEATLPIGKGKESKQTEDVVSGEADSDQPSLVVLDSSFRDNSAEETGGTIYAERSSAVSLTGSSMEESSAAYGGAVAIAANSSANVVECRFELGKADVEGGIWHVENATAVFSDCSFEKSTAEFGGLVYAADDARVNLTDSVLASGKGAQGGCLFGKTGAYVHMENVKLKNCKATERGGAVSLQDGATANLADSELQSNQATEMGGGVYANNSSTLKSTSSSFHQNSAQAGGATALESDSKGEFTDATFTENSATKGGGVSYVNDSSLEVVGCTVQSNTAKEGGSFHLSTGLLSVGSSDFTDGTSEGVGGFVLGEEFSSVVLRDVSMKNGKAEDGGAVALRQSSLEAANVKVSECKARREGGALFGSDASTVLCTGCVLEDNSAAKRGGAVSFTSNGTQLLAVQFDKSSILNNQADYGGGLHFAGAETASDCSAPRARCTFVALSETTFLNNRAVFAGGAIFSNDLGIVRVNCTSKAKWPRSEFFTRRQWESMHVPKSEEDVCPSWKSNKAGDYGRSMASYARRVKKMVHHAEGQEIVEVYGDRYVVRNHPSGGALPTLLLQLTDDLGQGPAIGAHNGTMEATMTSPDGLFAGSVSVPLTEGHGSFSGVTGVGQPGSYEVVVEFSEDYVQPFVIEVQVRECSIGEVLAVNGTYCQKCSAATFNFLPKDGAKCRPCPADANCETRVIRPKNGFWHQTPCSERLQRCLTTKACDYKARDQRLTEMVDDVDTCSFDEEFKANYSDAQCRKGYEGPLCGSCKANYGKSQGISCERCCITFGSVVLLLLSILILLSLVSFNVRSNLVSFVSMGHRKAQASTSAPGGPSTSSNTNSPPSGLSMMTVWYTNEARADPKDPKSPTQVVPANDHMRITRSAEMAKWKAVEMLKITVNYLQVMAVAISINVDWSVAVVSLLEAAEFLGGVTSEATSRSIDCLVSDDSSVERSIIRSLVDIVIPLSVAILFVIFWTIAKFRYKETVIYFIKKTLLSSIAVFYISFISISMTLINILNCVEVHDSDDFMNDSMSKYWAVDTSIKCYEGSHAVLAGVVGWPLLLFFTFGFPIALASMILRQVQEDYEKGWVYDVSGFLYRSFRKRFVFWESIIMLRKASVVVVVVLCYPLGPNLQAILAIFVLALASYFQAVCRPYREEFEVLNEMEGVSILVSLLMFVSSLFYNDDRISDGVRIMITVGISVCSIGVFLAFLAFFLFLGARYLKTVLDREDVAYDSDGDTCHIYKVYFLDHMGGIIRDGFGMFVRLIVYKTRRRSDS